MATAAWRVPSLEDLPDPAGRRVLVRATLDLPLGSAGNHPMARRRAAGLASTLGWLAGRGAEVTVCGDAGAVRPEDEARRFAEVRKAVEGLLEGVAVADDTAGGGASAEDPAVIDRLVGAHGLFVNDSFQWSYLPVPSLVVPPRHLPAAAGRSLELNLEALGPLIEGPARTFVAVLGGDRSYLRLHGLQGLVLRTDMVLVGGAMALPFLQAVGRQPADGVSADFLDECRWAYGLAERVQHPVQLPVDLVWEQPDGALEVTAAHEQPGGTVVDIGPRSALRFAEMVEGASTVLWTGALGRVEDPRAAAGTRTVAAALGGGRVVLGGDALMALLDGSGATPSAASVLSATDPALELLKNGDLPALMALRAGTGTS